MNLFLAQGEIGRGAFGTVNKMGFSGKGFTKVSFVILFSSHVVYTQFFYNRQLKNSTSFASKKSGFSTSLTLECLLNSVGVKTLPNHKKSRCSV